MKKKIDNFFTRLRYKYRFAIFNEKTYEEVWRIRLSRLNVFTVVGAFAVILVIAVLMLIAYTSLREYIPGYPNAEQRKLIVSNANRVDSLISEIHIRDEFFQSMKAVVNGDIPSDSQSEESADSVSSNRQDHLDLGISDKDKEFRRQVEEQEKYSVSQGDSKSKSMVMGDVFIHPPLNGIVTNHFLETSDHYGVDIVAGSQATVSAVLDGTIIFAGWTVETGYVIMIQHDNNLVSVYKHNSVLLKEMGDQVIAGQAIANVGNSGEFSTGPHLHFELWYEQKPINPEDYIVFE